LPLRAAETAATAESWAASAKLYSGNKKRRDGLAAKQDSLNKHHEANCKRRATKKKCWSDKHLAALTSIKKEKEVAYCARRAMNASLLSDKARIENS
jgi:hypothetical protein